MIFIDGAPDIFVDRKTLDEYLDAYLNSTPLDINVEGDAYADGGDDEADHYDDVIINYNCLAWE
jgi:hypothetical protein